MSEYVINAPKNGFDSIRVYCEQEYKSAAAYPDYLYATTEGSLLYISVYNGFTKRSNDVMFSVATAKSLIAALSDLVNRIEQKQVS